MVILEQLYPRHPKHKDCSTDTLHLRQRHQRPAQLLKPRATAVAAFPTIVLKVHNTTNNKQPASRRRRRRLRLRCLLCLFGAYRLRMLHQRRHRRRLLLAASRRQRLCHGHSVIHACSLWRQQLSCGKFGISVHSSTPHWRWVVLAGNTSGSITGSSACCTHAPSDVFSCSHRRKRAGLQVAHGAGEHCGG